MARKQVRAKKQRSRGAKTVISEQSERHENGTKIRTYISVGVVTLAALLAYFLYGSKRAEENRMKIKSFMQTARAELLEQLERADILTRDEYEGLVLQFGRKYQKLKSISSNTFGSDTENYLPQMTEMGKHVAKIAVQGAARALARDVLKKVAGTSNRADEESAPRGTQNSAPPD